VRTIVNLKGRKILLPKKIKTVFGKVVPANLVPAAAVIREGQVLFVHTGRKAFLGGFL
jgi:hypothetical protein